MRTPQLLLFFLLLCETTESLSNKHVNLGQNVTLDCPIDVKDIYWFFLKLPDSLVVILRTFSSESTSSHLHNERFKDKYSSRKLSHLFIHNITIDELGIYYCEKTGQSPQLSNGTRLYITESAQDYNQTENNNQIQPQCDNNLTVTSITLNVVLIITITGLLILKFMKPTKSRQQRQNVEPEQLEDFNTAQYSEIELPTYSREENPKPIHGTYALLQKPKAHPRVQHVNIQSC